jgi:hypothetical protein
MDRRDFIKLTAITGTSATLASCGNPEHQLIRFVPDDELVPGVAEWKPSVCPLCSAGCGLTVRVMEADAEVVRNGQQGVVRIAAAKKLEGQPDHPINQGGLCPRGQPRFKSRITRSNPADEAYGRARHRRIQADHMGRGDRRASLTSRSDRRRKRPGVGCVPHASATQPPARAASRIPEGLRRAGANHVRALRRRGAAPGQRAQLRPRQVPTIDPGARPLRDCVWRPLGTGTRRSRRARRTARCGRDTRKCAALSFRSSLGCRRPAPTRTTGCR